MRLLAEAISSSVGTVGWTPTLHLPLFFTAKHRINCKWNGFNRDGQYGKFTKNMLLIFNLYAIYIPFTIAKMKPLMSHMVSISACFVFLACPNIRDEALFAADGRWRDPLPFGHFRPQTRQGLNAKWHPTSLTSIIWIWVVLRNAGTSLGMHF